MPLNICFNEICLIANFYTTLIHIFFPSYTQTFICIRVSFGHFHPSKFRSERRKFAHVVKQCKYIAIVVVVFVVFVVETPTKHHQHLIISQSADPPHTTMVLSSSTYITTVVLSCYLYSGLSVAADTTLEHCAVSIGNRGVKGMRLDYFRFARNAICGRR